jgi:Nuclease-related domain
VGGALLVIRDAPAHERVWETGAGGEEATARYLAKRCPGALVLHDRRIPRSTANIDHIAVVPGGVYVIDSKRYKNRKIRVATPLIGSQKFLIDGSDRTKLVDGLLHQVGVVSEVLSAVAPGVPVHGVFCFIDADVPLLGTPTIRELAVLNRRRLARRLRRKGPLGHDRIREIASELAHRLPAHSSPSPRDGR